MNTSIHTGHVWHDRLNPVRHRFSYPFVFARFDLDELEALDKRYRWFGLNHFAPWSIHQNDYLGETTQSIKEKILAYWKKENCDEGVERVDLVTVPRWFGYVFNPVSFYLGLSKKGVLQCAAAEVNNTFKEKHLYVLPTLQQAGPDAPYIGTVRKDFHVSPFYDMHGEYLFRFFLQGNQLRIDVDKTKDGGTVFHSGMTGKCRPFGSATFMKTTTKYPLTATLAMPRIIRQAIRLHYDKKLPVYAHPVPESAMTIGHAPATFWQRKAYQAVSKVFRKLSVGELTLRLPDQTRATFGGSHKGPKVTLDVISWKAFPRMLRHGAVGFGEAYTEGEIDLPDVTAVIDLFISNAQHHGQMPETKGHLGKWANRLLHRQRANTLKGSKENIHAHYNLSNELFTRLLGPSMSYSSAVYDRADFNLEEAQYAKHDRILRKSNIGPDDHVLEIGCGWGAFAIQAVQQTGCRVTGITLSQEQKLFAEQAVREAGLEDRIEIRLQDYREVTGVYDAIVSIEMLEAVGHDYFPSYFQCLNDRLKPGGKATIQVITIPESRYESYRNGCDWIQKYIFPGGHLPSEEVLADSTTQWSTLRIADIERIGPHYARTLAEWRNRFLENWEEISEHGFDERFKRMWLYYLGYCEAAFAREYINNVQVVFEKPS